MTSVEEKIDTVKSRFAGGNLLTIGWNSLMHTREFVVLKKPYMSITWKRLS
ncbi:MAG: hypothetical protein ABSD42_05030 [Candidatus Bathyarchaeia archaeon]|jgi:hypothetical protein